MKNTKLSRRILVTGGAGFVGSSLVRSLLDKGHFVRVLDKVEGKLREWRNPNLEIVVGNIEDVEKVQIAVKGTEVVYHLAESYSPQPREVLNTDVTGNLNLLEKAREHNIKHFLFTSTTRVYGKVKYAPVDEKHPCAPEESGRPLYAIAKFTNEKLCLFYYKEYNLPVTLFRFWWAYGTEIGGRALRNLVDTALQGREITVPAEAGGSFLHNEDMAQAFQLATLNNRAFGQAFNLSSGGCTTWQELAGLVCELTASSSQIKLVPRESWGEDSSLGTDANIPELWDIDIRKAQSLLGYQPRYRPREITQTIQEALKLLVASRRK